ncbi:hypothetical protein FQA39_LY02310 [Lamprigera yunnana]|nr:hypothetical protein FQA39_LY02310 [Lamprigera yunnana]
MTLWFCIASGTRQLNRHVSNSVLPSATDPTYNITSWVRQLHLQQCVLVEIGEKYYGVYVEYHSPILRVKTEIQEYFLGLCDTETLHKWKLCSAQLKKQRPYECTFQKRSEPNGPSRIHRRLCNITELAFYADFCNCNKKVGGQKLYNVTGFPTCFLPSLPYSICVPSTCGTASCGTSTINQQVHTLICNPMCFGGQPFCELPGPKTARASKIESFWSDWKQNLSKDNQFLNPNDFVYEEATCINKNTCPTYAEDCKCSVYIKDSTLKLFRKYKLKQRDLQHYNEFTIDDKNATNFICKRFAKLLENDDGRCKRVVIEYEEADDNEQDLDDDDVILEESNEDVEPIATTIEVPENNEIHSDMISELKNTLVTDKEKALASVASLNLCSALTITIFSYFIL